MASVGKTTNLDPSQAGRYAATHVSGSLVRVIAWYIQYSMTSDAQLLADFRSQVTKLLQERDSEWEASRRLVEASRLPTTLKRLIEEARRIELPQPVRESIIVALKQGEADRIQDLPGPRLKELTGLPPTKAIRALCVWFDVIENLPSRWPISSLSNQAIETFIRDHQNPFDLLLSADVASVLDLGAGDLSFAEELAVQYAPRIRELGRTLTLHAVDRLSPQSQLGGPLHPERARLQMLQSRSDLSFRFFGDQDMCALEPLDRAGHLAPWYTILTCWAPATPTFAYEPTRLSAEVIQEELQRTKGAFHETRYAGEPALEVQHGGRALLFPPWKFEIRGPLMLLDVLARRGQLCLLAAVDNQVFWELLSQLLDDPRYRPRNQPFTLDNIPTIFGPIFERLVRLEIGESVNLADCGTLRSELPRVLPTSLQYSSPYRFSSIQMRRGAIFPNMPASSTARKFRDMVEEAPPWMVMLVPAR